MARITVLGGSGYAGSHIVKIASQRGHEVVSYSRSIPDEQVSGVTYRTGDVSSPETIAEALLATDVVISALSPRGALSPVGALRAIEQRIAEAALRQHVRFGVVGGAGSLLTHEGGPMLASTPEFGDEYRPEALEMASVLDDLRASDEELDWFFVSPAGNFGPWAPGELTEQYRLGDDVILTDAAGNSEISGPDLAHAIVREIEEPQHRRRRFTLAY